MILLELEFKAIDSNGKEFNFKLNDSIVNYKSMREHVSESICIDAIEKLKKESKKKCAVIFGNCQTIRLVNIFMNHIQFRKEYFLLEIPAVHTYNEKTMDLIFGGGGSFYN